MDTQTIPLLPGGLGERRTDRTDRLIAAGKAVVVGVIVFIAVIALITLLNTNTELTQGNKTLKAVNSTLNAVRHGQIRGQKILKEVEATAASTKNIADGLAAGNFAVDQILMKAGTTSSSLLAGLAKVTYQNTAICAALHVSC